MSGLFQVRKPKSTQQVPASKHRTPRTSVSLLSLPLTHPCRALGSRGRPIALSRRRQATRSCVPSPFKGVKVHLGSTFSHREKEGADVGLSDIRSLPLKVRSGAANVEIEKRGRGAGAIA